MDGSSSDKTEDQPEEEARRKQAHLNFTASHQARHAARQGIVGYVSERRGDFGHFSHFEFARRSGHVAYGVLGRMKHQTRMLVFAVIHSHGEGLAIIGNILVDWSRIWVHCLVGMLLHCKALLSVKVMSVNTRRLCTRKAQLSGCQRVFYLYCCTVRVPLALSSGAIPQKQQDEGH